MATVYGNLQGLKPSQIKLLEQLYEERISDSSTETLGDCFNLLPQNWLRQRYCDVGLY